MIEETNRIARFFYANDLNAFCHETYRNTFIFLFFLFLQKQ